MNDMSVHGRDMAAGRMPGYEQTVAVAVEITCIVPGPGNGGSALTNQLGHIDRRNQGVFDRDYDGAGLDLSADHEAGIFLVAAHPEPAMDEQADGEGAVAGRHEDVQLFAWMITIGDIQFARKILGYGNNVSDAVLEKMISDADEDGDGELDF